MAERLPIVGTDGAAWGTVLNGFLSVAHNSDGTVRGVGITPEMFGAVGNGVTDDSAALASWLTACAGKTAQLSDGKTYVSTTALSPSGGTLICGKGTLAFQIGTTGPGIQIWGVAGVTIRDITITTVGTRTAHGTALIWVNNATGWLIDNVEVVGGAAAGIYNTGGSVGGVIQRCRVHNCLGDGIVVGALGDSGCRCEFNEVWDVGGNGISVLNSSNTLPAHHEVIAHNWVHDLKSTGLDAIAVCGHDIDVVNNVIDGMPRHGIYVFGPEVSGVTYNAFRIGLYGNCITNLGQFTSGHGINLSACRDTEATHNLIAGVPGGEGIFMGTYGKNIKLNSNEIYNTGDRGIYLLQTSTTNGTILSRFLTAFNEGGSSVGFDNIDIVGNTVAYVNQIAIQVNCETGRHGNVVRMLQNTTYNNNAGNLSGMVDLAMNFVDNMVRGTNTVGPPKNVGSPTAWVPVSFINGSDAAVGGVSGGGGTWYLV